jgi:hypothetical protein
VAYIQNAASFIALKVFPIVPVDKQSDMYYSYDKNDWFRDEAKLRAHGTESAGSGYNISLAGPYFCNPYGFHKDIPWGLRKNADPGIDLDRDATELTTQRLLIRLERLFAGNFFITGVWGTDLTGVAGVPGANQFRQWNDYSFSDPINDIETGKELIKGVTGFDPNTLLIGRQAFRYLKNHPDIVDRYKHTQAGVITAELVAKVFEIERLIVADTIYASNAEGATAAYNFIYGKGALLCYVPPAPGLLVPSAGYTFAWKGVADNIQTNKGIAIETFPIRRLKVDRVEGEFAVDPRLIGADLGVFYTTAVA